MRPGLRWAWAVVVATAACSDVTVPESSPIQEGVIAGLNRLSPSSNHVSDMWVKTSADDACGIDYQISPGTEIWARDGDGYPRGRSRADLRVGGRVRVWVRAGEVMTDSCPQGTSAQSVEMLP